MFRAPQFASIKISNRAVLALGMSVMLSSPAPSRATVSTTTQSLSASISPIGKLSVSSVASLTPSAIRFSTYTTSVSINYRMRTTPTGGGTITVQAGSDFSPSGGPQVSAGQLTYVCSGASLGSGCSGTQTISTSVATPVVTVPASSCTGGGGSCSGADPNAMSINLNLTDSPSFATGNYSAQITFTISAT